MYDLRALGASLDAIRTVYSIYSHSDAWPLNTRMKTSVVASTGSAIGVGSPAFEEQKAQTTCTLEYRRVHASTSC